MTKKWAVCLSIIILVINFIPNLMQGPKVLADNPQTYKENVELLELENLNISYSMRDSGQQYEWEIYYKVNEKQNDKSLKLKFSIDSEQKVSVSSENN